MDVAQLAAGEPTETVKLVVWDLDDTFWTGTLSEEAVVPSLRNIELVKELAQRGIISSICSKNDPQEAEAKLRSLEVWDYFVLPSISFQSKGTAIEDLIRTLQLRPANVVFIDDNPTVRAEAAFACPGLVCLDSPDQLHNAMDSPALRGAPDPSLTRLGQYRLIANRHDSKQSAGTSEEEFLRQSDIRVDVSYDIDSHIDRIIELVNRSNQLNFTKQRIETDAEREEFFRCLHAYGYKAGVVFVADRYGDYGLVGFFLTLATLREYSADHFVFSCRIMNMGVEQYVYDLIKRPSVKIVGPVANPIANYADVNWITPGGHGQVTNDLRDLHLVLIGGCDMLQLSTYCSMTSSEFTNRDENGLMKRLDDPFFILDDIELVRRSELRPQVPAFNADDMLALDSALQTADVVIASLYRIMEFNYFVGRDGLTVRFDEDAVRAMLASEQGLWFVRNFHFREFSHDQRTDLVRQSIRRLAQRTQERTRVIVMLENVRKHEHNQGEAQLKNLYNSMVIEECARNGKLDYLDVNQVTSEQWVYDDGFHMTRQGYYELACAVRDKLATR